ncbi:polymorphic toxin-type HINT domain-containing protein [Neisseria sp. DTU_2020_1000833_1_SI_GRL_NUU_006]|uniref:polymorphic toxin-type HINT domain-containing protein n=1 Tax=Neisseria sicca TaxID=490 RepID=UPI000D3054A1|nr:polymorphic toxin-type HINT domain-containing protein [Neisseria sicca]WNU96770.1 polymorphic toxin-type HINT domain-containing protein [Neisseria sp. DTU_2020_1000833_1_SI_GRL_NUU_006]
MVKTADGYKAIARIRAGDRVFAKDEASGETGYKPVTAQYGNPYQETVYIEVSDGLGKIQTLVSNRIHPFYSDGKWIKAEDLKAGSRLFAENGAGQTVQSVTVKQEPLQAYNLTVADWHTYFVKGDKAETEGVWVHNECPPRKTPSTPVYRNDSEAYAAAKELGYRKIKERTRNDAAIFKKGNSYISRDKDGHNGGAWKEASSPEKLNKKETRNGTFDKNLNRIGD